MNHTQMRTKLTAIAARLEELRGYERKTSSQRQEVIDLEAEAEVLRMDMVDIIRSAGRGRSSDMKIMSGTPFSSERPAFGGDTRSAAMRLVEDHVRTGRLQDGAAGALDALLRSEERAGHTKTAEWFAVTATPAYERAWTALVSHREGHLLWSQEDRDAFRAAHELQRAMSTGGSSGGYMVPGHLDPAVLLTSAGFAEPGLAASVRNELISTTEWAGVSSAGVTAEWTAEGAEASDGSPTLEQPTVSTYKSSAFIPWSIEVGMDGANFVSEIQRLLLDGMRSLHAAAIATGSGSGQPTGIVTALTGSASELTGAGTEALASADAYALQNSLPARFQPLAQFAMALPSVNEFRQFETGNGSLRFPSLHLEPPTLLGKGVVIDSNLPVIDPSVTATARPVVYGDFSQYLLATRAGSTLEIIPHLFGTTSNRPTGQRGAYLWARVGGDVLTPEAFRMISVATTA